MNRGSGEKRKGKERQLPTRNNLDLFPLPTLLPATEQTRLFHMARCCRAMPLQCYPVFRLSQLQSACLVSKAQLLS